MPSFQQNFSVVDSLVFQERAKVVTINPLVFPDQDGGFLVVENGEHQVRVYSRTGELKEVFGDGAAEARSLRAPTGAARLGNKEIVATSLLSNRLTIIPAPPDQPVRYSETPIRPLEGVQVLDEHQLLLTGPDAPYAKNMLHIWDLERRGITRSFFPPPSHVDSNVVLVLGRVHVASRGDRLAVLHSLSDTLFLYDHAGSLVSSIHVPVEEFNAPKGPLPTINSTEKRQEWANQWTLLWDVFWGEDNTLIVQWVKGRRGQATYGLVQMDTAGRRIWALARTPRLLGVRDGRFLFQGSAPTAPNRMVVAVRRDTP